MTYSHDAEDQREQTSGEDENEPFERRQNEIQLILAAYTPDEVWVSTRTPAASRSDTTSIVRRLLIKQKVDDNPKGETSTIALELCVSMPRHYLTNAGLCIDSLTVAEERLDNSPSSRLLLKAAYNAIPELIQRCREVADSFLGEESVWMVFAAVDEWLTSNRHRFDELKNHETIDDRGKRTSNITSDSSSSEPASKTVTLGRRLIYSHHIIAKAKRADLASLFREFDLTGFVKIGWPGLILIEGVEDCCQAFFDTIKRWSWQYLVVRGEMQEPALVDGHGHFPRLLPPYMEVSDMSIVSRHCQSVGLEALFRTLMKVYDAPATTPEPSNGSGHEGSLYGALVHVDHMNNGRAYRKWLRKACQELDVCLLIKECHTGTGDQSSPTRIIVVLVGDESNVRAVLKKWRTSRVDIDSRGRSCLERMMTIMHETSIQRSIGLERMDWDALSSDANLGMNAEDASNVIASIGVSLWVELLSNLFAK
jgi:hypothetical protein